jgi:hypothetical protein
MKHDAPVSPAPRNAGVPSLNCGSFDRIPSSLSGAELRELGVLHTIGTALRVDWIARTRGKAAGTGVAVGHLQLACVNGEFAEAYARTTALARLTAI